MYKLFSDFKFTKPLRGSVVSWWKTSKEGTGLHFDLPVPTWLMRWCFYRVMVMLADHDIAKFTGMLPRRCLVQDRLQDYSAYIEDTTLKG